MIFEEAFIFISFGWLVILLEKDDHILAETLNAGWKNSFFLATRHSVPNSICAILTQIYFKRYTKAKLLLLKLIYLFARQVLLVKKLKIEETKTT